MRILAALAALAVAALSPGCRSWGNIQTLVIRGDTIGAWVDRLLGDRPFQRKVTDLVLGLRAGALR